MEEFIKERNEALLSKNKDKILAYCIKYNINTPKQEDVFWTGVHKAICNLFLMETNKVSIELYQESFNWLERHEHILSIEFK